jgi:hypothetical protein
MNAASAVHAEETVGWFYFRHSRLISRTASSIESMCPICFAGTLAACAVFAFVAEVRRRLDIT